MGTKRYVVKVVRPLFQVALVTVEAKNEKQAVAETFAQADSIPDEHWHGTFNPADYGYEIHCLSTEDDPELEDIIEHSGSDAKYILAKADINSGEGEVVVQPWLNKKSPLMVADLSMDWSADFQKMREEGAETFFEWLQEMVNEKKKTIRSKAKIIPFTPRKK